MGFFRICKNDITDLLRHTFNASPLRVPESRVKPLIVVGRQGKKVNFRGQLGHLLEGDPALDVPFEESTLANTSLKRSQSISLDFGLKIMEGFLAGLGIPAIPINSSLKGVKEISFSFNDAKRIYIDPNLLGNELRGKKIDLKHPSVGMFTKNEDPFEMLLISDAIVCKSFVMNIEKTNESEFEAALPELKKMVEMEAKVKIDTTTNRSITFEGDEFLTFAFTCVKLELDKASGLLQIGETVITRQLKGEGEVEIQSPYAMIDEDEFEPGMIEWENE
jgi:hypothetical protein